MYQPIKGKFAKVSVVARREKAKHNVGVMNRPALPPNTPTGPRHGDTADNDHGDIGNWAEGCRVVELGTLAEGLMG